MPLDFMFFLNSVLFGLGLAMDAFSVSLANGLAAPCMSRRRQTVMAGIFALFQMAMPLIGWLFVHTVMQWLGWLEVLIPWVSLVLLSWIGGKMLFGALRGGGGCAAAALTVPALLLQAVATSIDAFSVGLTLATYEVAAALLSAAIIGGVTFFVCFAGVEIGKHFGVKLSHRAEALGGTILILIGIEIFLTGILG